MTTADQFMSDEPHDQAEELLPWYATGRLEAPERERVEAHLAGCADCRDQLALERRRIEAFRSFSPEVESGWKRVRDRIAVPTHGATVHRPPLGTTGAELWAAFTRPAVIAFATMQIVFLTFASGLLLWLTQPTYRALGSNAAPASADLLIMFRAGATEQDLRSALQAAGGTLVGGPTTTGAYLVHVDPPRRDRALASLQSNRKVQMAQPISAGAER